MYALQTRGTTDANAVTMRETGLPLATALKPILQGHECAGTSTTQHWVEAVSCYGDFGDRLCNIGLSTETRLPL